MARLCKLKEHSLSSYPNWNNNTISESGLCVGGEKCWRFFCIIFEHFFSPSLFLWLKQVRTSTFPVTSCLQLTHPWGWQPYASSCTCMFFPAYHSNFYCWKWWTFHYCSVQLNSTFFLWKLLQFNILPYFSTLSRNKSTHYKQSSKYIRSLTLSLASAVQYPQFLCFSDLWVPSFSRILEGQPWGNSASRSRAREAALRANCALHPLSCSFYPLFALSLQKKDT